MNVSDFQNATVSLSRSAIGQNLAGGTTRTPQTLLSGIVAAVQPASGKTIYLYDRRGIKIDTTIYIDSVDFLTANDVNGNPISDLRANDIFTDDAGRKFKVEGWARLNQPQLGPPQYQIDTSQMLPAN